MHIGVLIQDFPPETGAGPARTTELAAAWIAEGHRVTVLTAFPSRRLPGRRDGEVPVPYRGRVTMREDWLGIDVHRSWLYTSPTRGVGRTLLNHATFAVSSLLYGIARLPRLDVLIASGPPYFSQFSGALLAAWQRIPLMLEIRDLWPDYVAEMGMVRNRAALRAMFSSERWLLRRARASIVVTESFRERLVGKGADASRIDVIPNGVDVSRYYPSEEAAPLDAMRPVPGERVVGYLGTFGAGQGLQAVLDAARLLRARRARVRVVLVGDGQHRRALEDSLARDPIEGVSLHPPIPRDDTRAFYNACDVVLIPHAALPVLADTVPSKIFEAMACARPLVAALKGEGARIVACSGGGVLATPGDAQSIADAIERVLALSDAERAALGNAGRAFALAEYDRATLARRYLERLQRVVAAP